MVTATAAAALLASPPQGHLGRRCHLVVPGLRLRPPASSSPPHAAPPLRWVAACLPCLLASYYCLSVAWMRQLSFMQQHAIWWGFCLRIFVPGKIGGSESSFLRFMCCCCWWWWRRDRSWDRLRFFGSYEVQWCWYFDFFFLSLVYSDLCDGDLMI